MNLGNRGVAMGVESGYEGGRRAWNGLLKISLADSEGVIVAVVITERVSSSSSYMSATEGVKDDVAETGEYDTGRGGG